MKMNKQGQFKSEVGFATIIIVFLFMNDTMVSQCFSLNNMTTNFVYFQIARNYQYFERILLKPTMFSIILVIFAVTSAILASKYLEKSSKKYDRVKIRVLQISYIVISLFALISFIIQIAATSKFVESVPFSILDRYVPKSIQTAFIFENLAFITLLLIILVRSVFYKNSEFFSYKKPSLYFLVIGLIGYITTGFMASSFYNQLIIDTTPASESLNTLYGSGAILGEISFLMILIGLMIWSITNIGNKGSLTTKLMILLSLIVTIFKIIDTILIINYNLSWFFLNPLFPSNIEEQHLIYSNIVNILFVSIVLIGLATKIQKNNSSRNEPEDSTMVKSTQLKENTGFSIKRLRLSLIICSLVAVIYLVIFDSFLITKTVGTVRIYSLSNSDFYYVILDQFNLYNFYRFSVNINGFYLGSILILIGILGSKYIKKLESSRLKLALISSVLQLPTGIILIISSSLSIIGYNRRGNVADSVQTLKLFKIIYWLEIVCYILLLISIILLVVSVNKHQNNNLKSVLIAGSIGLSLAILAAIFSILTVNICIDIETVLSSPTFKPDTVAWRLIPALTLSYFSKIIIATAFLVGLFIHQKDRKSKLVKIFSIIIALFFVLKMVSSILIIVNSFTIFPEIVNVGRITLYYRRLFTIECIQSVNIGLFWFLFFSGVICFFNNLASSKKLPPL